MILIIKNFLNIRLRKSVMGIIYLKKNIIMKLRRKKLWEKKK